MFFDVRLKLHIERGVCVSHMLLKLINYLGLKRSEFYQ